MRQVQITGVSVVQFRLICVAFCFLIFIGTVAAPQLAFASTNSFTFDLTVSGLDGSSLGEVRQTFQAASLLEANRGKSITSIANLRRQLKSDRNLMTRILRAQGYYGARIDDSIARQGAHFELEMKVTPGALYRLGTIGTEFQDPRPKSDIIDRIQELIALQPGDPARAASVISAEARIADALPELGFPFARNIQRNIIVDHSNQSMNITYIIDSGIERQMGYVQFEGLKSVKGSYLHQFISWKKADTFKQGYVDALRARLIRSGLFTSVNISLEPVEDNSTDIKVSLVEAEQRTIGISGGYSTAEGFGGDISWEDRNLTGRGDRLRLTLRGAEIEQSLAAQYELPNFRRLDQSLSFESAIRRQDTNAFLSNSVEARANFQRVISNKLAVHAGLTAEFSDITDAEGDRDFFLTGLPVGLRWDNSDDLLDPRKGVRASFITTPTAGFGDDSIFFVKNELRASSYYSFNSYEQITAAFRARLGSITGTANETLPATERFFAGGGGSVRGFAFQKVGPLDREGDPLGGRSVAEVGAEIRWKISQTIGIVPFIDGGAVYEEKTPRFTNFRWGAGLGLRYHTAIGPIRLDVATPIDRRQGEDRFQFYISLGQAF